MASITSWTRLESRTRSEDMRSNLQAQIHDPVWQLARQWQFGEFHGEDAGSPVTARAGNYHCHAQHCRGQQSRPAGGDTVYGKARW